MLLYNKMARFSRRTRSHRRPYKTHRRKHYRRHETRRQRRNSMKRFLWTKHGAPDTHQRTVMLRKCGKTCFLGPNKSFPICRKGTCRKDWAGIHAAWTRAREMITISREKGRPAQEAKYRSIARRAKRMLDRK